MGSLLRCVLASSVFTTAIARRSSDTETRGRVRIVPGTQNAYDCIFCKLVKEVFNLEGQHYRS